jgi:regulatory protein
MPYQAKKYTPNQALEKLKHYCSYTERSHYDVEQQLFKYGVYKQDAAFVIATLIEQNYLNEERYVKQMAGGKHRIKHWGRNKIIASLKQKGITNSYLVKTALKEIDEEVYLKKLQNLAEKKFVSLKGEQYLVKKKKLMVHLLQKGYEAHLVNAVVEKLTAKK